MAFKLDKKQLKAKAEFIDRLTAAAEEVKVAVNTYNEILEDVRTFVTEIHEQWDSDISEKSERWQEGDAGQAASDLKDTWEGADLEDLDTPDVAHADTLQELADEAG